MGVVVYDMVVRGYLPPDHRDELLLGVGPVGACSVDDSDGLARHVREFLKEPGQQAIRGQRTGDVRDHDGDPVLSFNEFLERRGADWIAHRFAEGRLLVWQPLPCFVLSTVTFEDGISTVRSPLPYCNSVSTVCSLLLSSLAGVCEVPLNLTDYAWEMYPHACKPNY